jgi:hypothetical protein
MFQLWPMIVIRPMTVIVTDDVDVQLGQRLWCPVILNLGDHSPLKSLNAR